MLLRFARWWVVLLGGALLGVGLCLHGQLAVARVLREEVTNTFFLWRAIGQVTFIFQDDVTQAAIWMHDVPDAVMRESDSAAWVLVAIGALLALSAPMLRRRRAARSGQRASR